MGRIKTIQIKNVAEKLMELMPDKFSMDFDVNKKIVFEKLGLNSKSTTNKIAGYITHLMKNKTNPKTFETPYQQKDEKRKKKRR